MVLESRMVYTITVKGRMAFDTLFKVLLASATRIVSTFMLKCSNAFLTCFPILLVMTVQGTS